MREQDIKWIVLGLLLVFLFNCIGCGGDTDTRIITQFCKVERINNDGVITCPDGSTVTVPPEIITTTTETIINVPVLIHVPNNDKEHGNCKKD